MKSESTKRFLVLCIPTVALVIFAIVAQYMQPIVARKRAHEEAERQQHVRYNNTITLCNALKSLSTKSRIKTVGKLLSEGVNINGNDGIGVNAGIGGAVPLYVAANYDTPTVAWLLRSGANVNGAYGCVPLCQATRNSDIPMMRLLLDKGATPDLFDRDRYNALMSAAGNNDVEGVRLLLHRGAKVNLKRADGETVLDMLDGAQLNMQAPDYREVEKILKRAGAKYGRELK